MGKYCECECKSDQGSGRIRTRSEKRSGCRRAEIGEGKKEQAKRGKEKLCVLLQYVTISPPMEKIACPHASLKLTISIVNTQNSLIRNKHK